MVVVVGPTDRDFIIDPTCGSGGFLLETLLQVWHYIDRNYKGQKEVERRKYDFAHENLFGIEVHDILGRVCYPNLSDADSILGQLRVYERDKSSYEGTAHPQ